MKKFLSLALLLIISLSCVILPSCKKQTPYELVSEAIANTNTYSTYKASLVMDMEMSMAGMTIDTKSTQEMQVSGIDTDNPVARLTQTTDSMGTETVVDTYVKDGTYYISVLGQKIKIPKDKIADSEFSDMSIEEDMGDLSDVIVALPQEAFAEETVIVENEDGTKSVEIRLTAEQFKTAFSEFVKGITDTDGISELKTSDAKVKVTVKDKKVVAIAFDVDLEMTVTSAGMQINTKMTVNANFSDINAEFTPSPLENLDSYQELSEEAE